MRRASRVERRRLRKGDLMIRLGLGNAAANGKHATGTRSSDAPPVTMPGLPDKSLGDLARYHARELEGVKHVVASFPHHQVADEIAQVLASNPFMLHGVADERSYLWVSPSVRRVLGYEQDEVVGRALLDFVHPDDVDATKAAVVRLRERPIPATFDNRVRTGDGGYRRLLWVATQYEQGKTFFLAIPVDTCPSTTCPRRRDQ